jgi:hypothetical protein
MTLSRRLGVRLQWQALQLLRRSPDRTAGRSIGGQAEQGRFPHRPRDDWAAPDGSGRLAIIGYAILMTAARIVVIGLRPTGTDLNMIARATPGCCSPSARNRRVVRLARSGREHLRDNRGQRPSVLPVRTGARRMPNKRLAAGLTAPHPASETRGKRPRERRSPADARARSGRNGRRNVRRRTLDPCRLS